MHALPSGFFGEDFITDKEPRIRVTGLGELFSPISPLFTLGIFLNFT
jgi:hypothetical protein